MKIVFFSITGMLVSMFAFINKNSITSNITAKEKHFKGAFSNGMKGDSIFFTVSADNNTLSELTFKGYWRCSGTLERTAAGPEGTFSIINGKVNDHISEPPGGGSTAWRFDLNTEISSDKAEGTFRMNINALGCDTYLLKFTAEAY
jgi:hypothetical protein